MECDRCGTCCYWTPCPAAYQKGKGHPFKPCPYVVVRDNKAYCQWANTPSKKNELAIGKGCGYFWREHRPEDFEYLRAYAKKKLGIK